VSTRTIETKNPKNTSPVAEDKLDFKKILPIFVVVLIDLLGLTIIIPLLPLYATSFGANPEIIGLLGATYPLMQFLGAPLLGRMSDRYGRKPIMIASQIGTLIGFLVLGFANTLAVLFLARIIDGLSGANISTAQAMIADSTSEKTRTQGLGLLGAAFGLGFILGPVIAYGALALTGNNYHAPAFIAAGFSALSIALSWFWLQETHQPDAAPADRSRSPFSFAAMFKALTLPQIGLLLVLLFAQQIAFGGFEQMLSLFTLTRLGMDAADNSLVFVFVGVLVVAVQGGLLGRWSRKWGDRKLIYAGLAALALGLALTALTPPDPVPWYSQARVQTELHAQQTLTGSVPATGQLPIALPANTDRGWGGLAWLLVAMIPASIGGGILQPSINSLLTKRVKADERGGILGVGTAFLSAANALAPLIGGAIFQMVGPSAPFWIWAGIMGVLLLVTLSAIKPGSEPRPAPIAA
jgi:DHA1 family tetracycline resistance protein-like MFS transporter